VWLSVPGFVQRRQTDFFQATGVVRGWLRTIMPAATGQHERRTRSAATQSGARCTALFSHIDCPGLDSPQYGAKLPRRSLRVVRNLCSQPVATGQPKETAEPQVCVSSNGALACDYFTDSLRRHIDFLGQAVLTDSHRCQKFLQKEFTRSYRFELAHDGVTSVVINDFNVFGTRIRPTKAQAPLIIDTNTVLARFLSFQRFEAIAWRHSQIIQSRRNLNLSEFPSCNRLNVHEALNTVASSKRFRVRTSERYDHAA
jgi:hypothetical protein